MGLLIISCTDDNLQLHDKVQKAASVNIKGYSKPDAIQLKFKGVPVVINDKTSYTDKIETKIDFVLDEGESNELSIYNTQTGTEIKKFNINYDNFNQYKELNFFNLPEIFLQTTVVKPQVNLGRVGFQFIFANLGEFSGYSGETIKGVLKRENGVVLAEFANIGKDTFSELKIYTFFSATAPVYLEIYKPGTTEPYSGNEIIKVKIKQDIGANMIVLQEKNENGKAVVSGDIDVADYL